MNLIKIIVIKFEEGVRGLLLHAMVILIWDREQTYSRLEVMEGDLTIVCTASGQTEAVYVVQRCMALLQSLNMTPVPDQGDSVAQASTAQNDAGSPPVHAHRQAQ